MPHGLSVVLFSLIALGTPAAAGEVGAARRCAARPLAAEYQVVAQSPDPKRVFLGTPAIARLPGGRYVVTYDLFSGDCQGCVVLTSDDGGKTWEQISTNGITWGSLFHAKAGNDRECGALYMIGNDPHKRDIRIIRSSNGGRTWSDPVVLFDDSRYHGSATPVHEKNGFLYRAFEDMNRGSASLVVAGDLSRDLLDPAAWRMSNKVEPPCSTPCLTRKASSEETGRDRVGNWFLEGNVVEIRGECTFHESIHPCQTSVVGFIEIAFRFVSHAGPSSNRTGISCHVRTCRRCRGRAGEQLLLPPNAASRHNRCRRCHASRSRTSVPTRR